MRAQQAEITRQHVEVTQQRAEIARLRAENRALLNSILGIAGLPPVLVTAADDAEKAGSEPAGLPSTGAGHGMPCPYGQNASVAPREKSATLATPTRRRSWQQIHRALELAAVQKKDRPEQAST
jgi:hypothetical protein